MVANAAVPPARTTAAMASPAAFHFACRAPSSPIAKCSALDPLGGTCSATISSARPATPRRALVSGTKTRSASCSARRALSVRCSGSPGTDADADQHAGAHAIASASRRRVPAAAAATSRAATAGVAAQWVCR